MCFIVIKNICSFSTAFYLRLVQQKVPAPQYVLLSFGFNYCDEGIQVQESHHTELLPKNASCTKRKGRELFIVSFIELIFMMFLLWGRLCTKFVWTTWMNQSQFLFSRNFGSYKIPSWKTAGGGILLIKGVRADLQLLYLWSHTNWQNIKILSCQFVNMYSPNASHTWHSWSLFLGPATIAVNTWQGRGFQDLPPALWPVAVLMAQRPCLTC